MEGTADSAAYWEGTFAYANLGVLLAFLLSFAITYIARRGRVQRQESGA